MHVRLTNARDLVRAACGEIRPEAARRVEAAAETDYGIASLVLPSAISEVLGLPDVGLRRVLYADGRWADLRRTGSVVLDIDGRALVCDGLVEPGRRVPRVGGAALSALGLPMDPGAATPWRFARRLPMEPLRVPRAALDAARGLATRRTSMQFMGQVTGPATPMMPALDETIARVESLYRVLTGREPPVDHSTRAPEREPASDVNAQLDRLAAALGAPSTSELQPALSVWESETEVRYCLEMPGVAREGVSIDFAAGTLRVAATTTMADAGFRLCGRERPSGEFRRTIALPPGIAERDVTAQMRDGVLEIRILRQPPAPDARPIPIA